MGLSKLMQLASAFKKNPRFVLMRMLARFKSVRQTVCTLRHYLQKTKWLAYKRQLRARMSESVFSTVDLDAFVTELRCNGVAFGLTLPVTILHEIRSYTEITSCYADRERDKGFMANQREQAESQLGKPILVAQYLNSEKGCREIEKLRNDPFLLLVAAEYLGSIPNYVGTNVWWTFPVQASEDDRSRHAHVFHRDVDDFRFFKFFFYLTDVNAGDGAHICVPGSHLRPPITCLLDRILVRRWSDQEISQFYGDENILNINGVAGTGFAEDTLCMHKGSTPIESSRLLLQMQFALFDYGVQNDHAATYSLKQIRKAAI